LSGLVLKLGPKERILINGAVIENGDRRSRLSVMSAGANILRLRDAIHPEDAKTPVRRVCYAVQLVLSGDATAEQAKYSLLRNIEELSQIFVDKDSRQLINAASTALTRSEHYLCLKALRALLPREERLLAVRN
jgi:flagellar protein FlbT